MHLNYLMCSQQTANQDAPLRRLTDQTTKVKIKQDTFRQGVTILVEPQGHI